jgi:hypothetical protein
LNIEGIGDFIGTASKKKSNLREKLRHLHVSTLVLVLYLLKLIDTNVFSKMNKIIHERNRLIHPVSTESGISYRDRKEKERAIELLEDAKYCIKNVKEGILK